MNNNSTATAMKVFGAIAIITGLIVGIVLGNAYPSLKITSYRTYTSFNWGIFLGLLFAFTFIGMLLIGIGEIIKLLTSIDNKTKTNTNSEDKPFILPGDDLPSI